MKIGNVTSLHKRRKSSRELGVILLASVLEQALIASTLRGHLHRDLAAGSNTRIKA